MDLPTCPSCGQSVLDDDAQDCPFCGAAMDGSSGGKKPAPAAEAAPSVKPSKPEQTKAEPDNDDPFAIAQSPVGKKVLQCAPKAMKGRSHRVVCPMCDTQGFIPKAAVGRQVRCANRECLVPVFEAAGKPTDGAPKAPARVSDSETPAPKKKSKEPSEKNPMVMYAVVGGVLLLLTLGLLSFLNKGGPDVLPPPDIPMPVAGPDEDDPDVDPSVPQDAPDTVATTDYRAMATKVIGTMVETARITSGNRDKPFCRRLTGDAYLRLGMDDKATAEFEQMDKIAANARRTVSYYRIAPLAANYWDHLYAGDKPGASQRVTEAKALASEIPRSGLLAVESSIVLAAAMVESGDLDGALALIERQQPDATVALQIDAVRHGVWMTTAAAIRDTGQAPLPPGAVFAWNEPLKVAVGAQLAIRSRWESGLAWASKLQNKLTLSDAFAVLARQMHVQNAAPAVRKALVEAARDPTLLLRVNSVLAQTPGSPAWAAAKSQLGNLPVEKQDIPVGVNAVIDAGTPDLPSMQNRGEALTDFVIAAIANEDDAAAGAGIQRIYGAMTSHLASTADLRAACRELERRDDDVKERVAKELGLPQGSQKIRSRFLAYRRGIDRQANVAEQRRMVLLQQLARIIRHGGLPVVKTALAAEDGLLKKEVAVDSLQHLLFVAAAAAGESFPEILEDDSALRVPISRVDPLPEAQVVAPLVEAWKKFQTSSNSSAAAQLELAPGLPGYRAAHAEYMTELASQKVKTAKEQMVSIAALKSDQWREHCLVIATHVLTRRGLLEEIQPVLGEAATKPTQKLVALYGIVRGALDLAKQETE